MMKKTTNLLCKWALGVCLLIAGVQNAFALNGQVCAEGTVYLDAPKTWTSAYAAGGGKFVPFTKQADGWWTVKSSLIAQGQDTSFFIASVNNDYCQSAGITNSEYDKTSCNQQDGIPCSRTGDLYIFADPTNPEKTVVSENPPNAKYFFIMIPPEMDEWMSAVPMLSMDGGATGKPMTAVDGMCGWYSYVFFNETITDNVVLYRDDDTEREDMIGLNGNWETSATATPIPLGQILSATDSLFFVPDEEQKGESPNGYFYHAADVEGIEGTCSYTMAAIIYDTDADLHPAFSCWSQGGEGCQAMSGTAAQGVDKTTAIAAINACIGVTPGIVESTLDETVPQNQRKPKLSTAGKKCFMDEKYFNQLFNYTKGVNEKSCFDMPFHRSTDGKWEFDSDFYTSPGLNVQGGFYPVEASTDATILAADPSQTPVAKARTPRMAEGPVFYGPALRENDPTEGIPNIDVLCNGPGWGGGIDCSGLFADGEGTETVVREHFGLGNDNTGCIFGWSCPNDAPKGWAFFEDGTETPAEPGVGGQVNGSPRWTSKTGRNQQFCFESHAKFTYKPGLKFNFRGDDDIWVFIDNQLAVDLGGTHLAAPGYVNLDKFKGKSGTLEVGKQYDLDIFFCDRRTTMSNVRIKTNMYIQQKTAIDVKQTKNKNNMAETTYDLCYTQTGDGSCASTMTGETEEVQLCGAEISSAGLPISYTLVQGNTISSPAVPGFENVSEPGVYKCGVDLTVPTAPKVDKSKMCLGGGRYTLFVNISGKTKKVATFRMSGDVDVVYANGVALDTTGKEIPGGRYTLQTSSIAGQTVPVYISSVAAGEGASTDVEIYPEDAKGVQYTLSFDDAMTVCHKKVDPLLGTETCEIVRPTDKLTIPDGGVDTVEGCAVGFEVFSHLFGDDGVEIFALSEGGVGSQSGVVVQILGAEAAAAHGAVLKPNSDGTSYSPCLEECNGFTIHKGVGEGKTSPGIDFIPDEVTFENGYATVAVRSLKVYRFDEDPAIDNPAKIVAEYNDFVYAEFTPVYFREPPVPIPVLADVFDVHGTTPSLEYKIPGPYFSMNTEYLDGIGDSIAIYYDRGIHQDSLPTKLCVLWDSTSAEEHNPFEEGYSKDTLTFRRTFRSSVMHC